LRGIMVFGGAIPWGRTMRLGGAIRWGRTVRLSAVGWWLAGYRRGARVGARAGATARVVGQGRGAVATVAVGGRGTVWVRGRVCTAAAALPWAGFHRRHRLSTSRSWEAVVLIRPEKTSLLPIGTEQRIRTKNTFADNRFLPVHARNRPRLWRRPSSPASQPRLPSLWRWRPARLARLRDPLQQRRPCDQVEPQIYLRAGRRRTHGL